MYTLHVANKNYSSWSLRPWVLMKTAGIPFHEEFHRFPPEGSYATFRAFSPTGLVPVLVDGDRHIWETLGIVEYLAEGHEGVWAADDFARAWSRSAASEMHAGFSALRNICGMNVGIRVTLPEFAPSLLKDLARLEELWADGFDRFGGPFLAGETFTAIDAFFCPVAFRVQTYGLPLAPRSAEYVQRLLALPAMQEWSADALKEDFRDWPHEKDHIAAGKWTADYRVKEAV
jgi:glutathione S-transferase